MNSNETKNKKPYHERQSKQLCALHALNNVLQDKHAFTQKSLDDICQRLSPDTFINPHKSMFGLGNYDVNVLMAALQDKGMETVWFDKRKSVNILDVSQIMGFILNLPSDFKFGFVKLPFTSNFKHWIAIRQLDGQFLNLDSKLESPELIGDGESLLQYLSSQLNEGDKELILIMDKSVHESGSWKKGGLVNGKAKAENDNSLKQTDSLNNTCKLADKTIDKLKLEPNVEEKIEG